MNTATNVEVKSSDLMWLRRAASLSGKRPLFTALLLLLLSRRFDRRQHIMITTKTRAAYGISQRSLYQALSDLAQAGLITVNRGHGRAPLVSIVDVSSDEESQHHPTTDQKE